MPKTPSSAGSSVTAAIDGEQDHHGRGQADAVEEAETEHEQAEHGDADGAAGEQHRTAGGVERAYRRLLGVMPAFRPLRCRVTMNSA